jgi:hypothetical protein
MRSMSCLFRQQGTAAQDRGRSVSTLIHGQLRGDVVRTAAVQSQPKALKLTEFSAGGFESRCRCAGTNQELTAFAPTWLRSSLPRRTALDCCPIPRSDCPYQVSLICIRDRGFTEQAIGWAGGAASRHFIMNPAGEVIDKQELPRDRHSSAGGPSLLKSREWA